MPAVNGTWLEFERPIVDLDRRLEELRAFAERGDPEFREEYERLSRRAEKLASRSTPASRRGSGCSSPGIRSAPTRSTT